MSMRSITRLIILFAFVIVVCLCAVFVDGVVLEKAVRRFVDGTPVRIESYERHWFDSSLTLRLPQGERVSVDIQHGPVAWGQKQPLVLGGFHLSLPQHDQLNPPYFAELQHLFGMMATKPLPKGAVPIRVTLTGAVGFDQQLHLDLDSDIRAPDKLTVQLAVNLRARLANETFQGMLDAHIKQLQASIRTPLGSTIDFDVAHADLTDVLLTEQNMRALQQQIAAFQVGAYGGDKRQLLRAMGQNEMFSHAKLKVALKLNSPAQPLIDTNYTMDVSVARLLSNQLSPLQDHAHLDVKSFEFMQLPSLMVKLHNLRASMTAWHLDQLEIMQRINPALPTTFHVKGLDSKTQYEITKGTDLARVKGHIHLPDICINRECAQFELQADLVYRPEKFAAAVAQFQALVGEQNPNVANLIDNASPAMMSLISPWRKNDIKATLTYRGKQSEISWHMMYPQAGLAGGSPKDIEAFQSGITGVGTFRVDSSLVEKFWQAGPMNLEILLAKFTGINYHLFVVPEMTFAQRLQSLFAYALGRGLVVNKDGFYTTDIEKHKGDVNLQVFGQTPTMMDRISALQTFAGPMHTFAYIGIQIDRLHREQGVLDPDLAFVYSLIPFSTTLSQADLKLYRERLVEILPRLASAGQPNAMDLYAQLLTNIHFYTWINFMSVDRKKAYFEDAIGVLEQLIEMQPGNPVPKLVLAQTLLQMESVSGDVLSKKGQAKVMDLLRTAAKTKFPPAVQALKVMMGPDPTASRAAAPTSSPMPPAPSTAATGGKPASLEDLSQAMHEMAARPSLSPEAETSGSEQSSLPVLGQSAMALPLSPSTSGPEASATETPGEGAKHPG